MTQLFSLMVWLITGVGVVGDTAESAPNAAVCAAQPGTPTGPCNAAPPPPASEPPAAPPMVRLPGARRISNGF